MPQQKIIFAGSGEFGLPTLRALHERGHEIVQVISQPDRPAGRGRALTPTPIAQFAIERKLSLLRTTDVNRELLPSADLMIVIAFGQKIAEHVVNHPRLGSINLHASRLPKYRGAAPINWAIIKGEILTGNSIIRVAPRMDAGAILAQSEVRIGEIETAGELHDRLSADGAALTLDLVDALANGRAEETPQAEELATTAPKLKRESAVIDRNRSAHAIANQIRGMFPWPGCRVKLIDADEEVARVTLVRATAITQSNAQPGTIDSNHNIAAGGGGAVVIHEVQPEGKRPMSLVAFRNGHRWEPGMRVESIA
jgi:methionyl-tRNA formyltransferase